MSHRREDAGAGEGGGSGGGAGDLKGFISHRDSTCDECHEELGHGAWLFLVGEGKAVCLACADLDHLAFLPPGNAALTRRAKKYSRLSAVVLKFSQARGRYERQGLLVEEAGLIQAEAECLADREIRQRRQIREAVRRQDLDERFVNQFAQSIRRFFPGCPSGREQTIAEHACQKYSGRVGRSAAAKELDEAAVRMAVAAHVRHAETNYDDLLSGGRERFEARSLVSEQIDRVLESWRAGRVQDDVK